MAASSQKADREFASPYAPASVKGGSEVFFAAHYNAMCVASSLQQLMRCNKVRSLQTSQQWMHLRLHVVKINPGKPAMMQALFNPSMQSFCRYRQQVPVYRFSNTCNPEGRVTGCQQGCKLLLPFPPNTAAASASMLSSNGEPAVFCRGSKPSAPAVWGLARGPAPVRSLQHIQARAWR